MQIVAHRGLWKTPDEKNTLAALKRAIALGYGIETDIHWMDSQLVISHDPPGARTPVFGEFLDGLTDPAQSLLALNIKCDGLQSELTRLERSYELGNYFVFDMSVPDMVGYLKMGIPCFTRQSDLEPDPVCYSEAAGVWMDTFGRDWMTGDSILRHIDAGKKVCIVSAELHGREPIPFWDLLASWDVNAMLCTDYPIEADRFFNATSPLAG